MGKSGCCVSDRVFHLIFCPLHREYSLSAENFLCRNHYFSKSPRQEPFFLCPNHELLSIFH